MRQLLATWAIHDLDHTSQIFAGMSATYDETVGPWKEFLGILAASGGPERGSRLMSEPADALRADDDAPYQPDDLERLQEYARKRGYRRFMALALFLAGCVPALLVVLATQGRSGSLPLVAALLVIVPTALLLFWTYRDRDGQDARELGMWVRTFRRAARVG